MFPLKMKKKKNCPNLIMGTLLLISTAWMIGPLDHWFMNDLEIMADQIKREMIKMIAIHLMPLASRDII